MVYKKSQNVQLNTKEVSGATVLLQKRYAYSSKRSTGSGFFVSTDEITTNIHVLTGAAKVTAKCVDTETVYAIEGILAFDDKYDLAVLKVAEQGMPFTLGDSHSVGIGDTVYVIGYPKAQKSRLEGTISAIRNNGKLIKLNIPDAGPGCSGAPVLNNEGEVIGIVCHADGNIHDVIPVNRLKELLTGTRQIEPDASRTYPGERSWISTLFRPKRKLEPVSSEVSPPILDSAASLPVETLKTWQKRPRIHAYIKESQGDDKFEKGNFKGAISAYNKSIKCNPDRAIVYNVRGIAKANLGDFKGAIVDFDSAIRLNPEHAGAYSNRGTAKHDLGDFEGAIDDYDQVIKLYPEDIYTYNNRGIAKDYLNDVSGAIEDYDNAIRINPKYAGSYNNRGHAKRKLGDFEGAINDFDQAIELNPEDTYMYNNRGHAKRKLGDYEGAIEDFDHVIKLNPEDIYVYNNRGIAKDYLDDVSGAIEDYDNAIRINPKYAGSYNNRGHAKCKLGDFEGAIEDYDQAIKLNPENTNVYINRAGAKQQFGESIADRGDIEEARGLYVAAIVDCTEAIQLEPKNASVYNSRGWGKYLLGQFENRHGNTTEARKQYQEAISDTDSALQLELIDDKLSSATYHTRGVAKTGLGDHHGAIEDFDESIRLNTMNALLYLDRGLSNESLGQLEAAAIDFAKVKELDPDFEIKSP